VRLPFHGGVRTIVKRDAMVIRVQTASGITGYAPGPGSENAQRLINGTIGPFLVGRILADPDALRVLFMEGPGEDADAARIYCAVEIALYDLAGKAMGLPVSEMIGGRVRDRIRLYGSAGMYMPPESYAAEAAGIRAAGFRAYKMRPAAGPETDLRTVELLRRTAPDMELMVDAHTWWRMGDRSYSQWEVEQLAEEMGKYRVAWLEEPLPPADHAGYARLRQKDLLPLAAGEHEPDEDAFLDLVATQAVDYVQMDVCCQGGYALGRRLVAEIARQGLSFAFHSWGTALEVMAAAHLGICWPQLVVEYLEYPCYSDGGAPGMYPFPAAREILKDPLEIERGDLVVPRAPGLGVAVDERAIERYPWVPGPWSYFEIESPPSKRAVTGDHSIPWSTK
jgi:L-alanine-DL-glutamate epimerase-like enolase superfamily enzyme